MICSHACRSNILYSPQSVRITSHKAEQKRNQFGQRNEHEEEERGGQIKASHQGS